MLEKNKKINIKEVFINVITILVPVVLMFIMYKILPSVLKDYETLSSDSWLKPSLFLLIHVIMTLVIVVCSLLNKGKIRYAIILFICLLVYMYIPLTTCDSFKFYFSPLSSIECAIPYFSFMLVLYYSITFIGVHYIPILIKGIKESNNKLNNNIILCVIWLLLFVLSLLFPFGIFFNFVTSSRFVFNLFKIVFNLVLLLPTLVFFVFFHKYWKDTKYYYWILLVVIMFFTICFFTLFIYQLHRIFEVNL